MLRSLIPISFLLLQLFSTTELGEVFKLPVLIHHYFEHESEHDHESILHFLKEHYSYLHATHNPHHAGNHKQLPFKTGEHGYLTFAVPIVPPVYSKLETVSFYTKKSPVPIKSPSTYSHFLADIWQPPRA